MSEQQEQQHSRPRLKITGRGNLPTKFADEYTPEERKWLREQHPDDYRVLVTLEKEHDKKYPPPPVVVVAEEGKAAGGGEAGGKSKQKAKDKEG